MLRTVAWCAVFACSLGVATAAADDWRLEEGTPDLKSAGPLAFGPAGILFVGDTKGGAVFAIDTQDAEGAPSAAQLTAKSLDQQLAQLLGVDVAQIQLNDLAVNPKSGNGYLSVMAGATPHLVRVPVGGGPLSAVSLKKARFSKAELPNPPEDRVTGEGRRRGNQRDSAITDLAYFDGRLLVSGLNADSSAAAIEIAFPFGDRTQATNIEIFHGAHGRLESNAVIRTFVPFTIDGRPSLLAGFQCTPLVKFPIDSLKPGEQVRGTTVAELGNRNRPLDMIVYKKDGKDYLLMANTTRGVMKISTDDIERSEGITERIGGTAGQSYETIEGLKGVVQLDRLNELNCVIVTQSETGLDLQTVPLP